ncbi:Cof-type HAD-IIB family hydrolase [Streptococcus merionis]|uniref:Cof-type HAD-IIB family hydrolase n=1 Tax=Streptococcus merionis TaxID=400065 RepID=UPI0026EBC64B|nr:Cof-type HAD-IIB family hydrolase [Streptococcus merionis]
MSKILFLDVDGTIVNYENQIPASAIKAIKLARKNGHKVYACTGRSRAEMQPELWEMGIDGMIGGNGNYIESDGEVVYHNSLTLEDCTAIVDYLHEHGLEFYLESNSGLYASENFEERSLPVMREYARRKGYENAETLMTKDALHGIVFGETNLYRDDVNKISFILESYQDYLDAKAHFTNFEVNTWGGKGEIALFGDVGVKDIDKAFAVEQLLSHLQAAQADTFAFGDAKIDIPMFNYCAYSVAMGSGGPEAKEAADYITTGVDEDGIYNAFKHLELI